MMTKDTTSNTQDGKANTTKTKFSRETTVSINIQTDPQIIWTLITNSADFPRWNSTIISIDGEIKLGKTIKLKSTLDQSRVFKLKVKSMTPEKEMLWGSGTAPFFKGLRTYTLEKISDNETMFTMSEKIGGWMFPMAAKYIPEFDASFEQFVADLKKEAELINQMKS